MDARTDELGSANPEINNQEEGVGSRVESDDPYADMRPSFAVRHAKDLKKLEKQIRKAKRREQEALSALENTQAQLRSSQDSADTTLLGKEYVPGETDKMPSKPFVSKATSVSSSPSVSLSETLSQNKMDANREALFDKCSDNFKRHHHIRQPFSNPFSGAKSQSLDEFLSRFNLWANRFCWTEQDKVFGLQMALDGSAAKTYDRLVANGSLLHFGLYGAIQKLRTAFPASSLSQTQAIARFSQLTQGDETVTDYSERFRDAMEQTTISENSALALALWCESVREDIRPHLMRFIPDDDAPQGSNSLSQAIMEAARVERNTKSTLGGDQKRRKVNFEDAYESATIRAVGVAPVLAEVTARLEQRSILNYLNSEILEPTLRQLQEIGDTQLELWRIYTESSGWDLSPHHPI